MKMCVIQNMQVQRTTTPNVRIVSSRSNSKNGKNPGRASPFILYCRSYLLTVKKISEDERIDESLGKSSS